MELDEGEKEVECGMVRVRPPLSLRLRNVSFRYDDRDVIDGFNAVIHPGKPAAIVGSSGKGKTTLIRLMLALIKPDRGEIVMETPDGTVPVSAATRANFAYVPQGNSLFSGTIRENLLLADPSASAEQLQHALETACAGFVYLLPDGLDTTVGESGYGLSEGQAQRIAITRALLCDSPVWLFDEITSALDSETSQQLVTNIMQAGREKTMIFVTHDRRLAGRCTQIITTDPGANPGYSAGTLHDGYEEKNK